MPGYFAFWDTGTGKENKYQPYVRDGVICLRFSATQLDDKYKLEDKYLIDNDTDTSFKGYYCSHHSRFLLPEDVSAITVTLLPRSNTTIKVYDINGTEIAAIVVPQGNAVPKTLTEPDMRSLELLSDGDEAILKDISW